MTSHAVYIFRDAAGRVLYVGATGNLPQRLTFHGDSKPWFSEVASVSIEHFPNRGAALAREAELIEALTPPYGGRRTVCHVPPCGEVATHYYHAGERARCVCTSHAPSDAKPILPRYRSGLPDGDPRHGTRNGYANHSCRCEPCTQANTEHTRAQRARADERASA